MIEIDPNQSVFNAPLAKLQRLHALKMACHESRISQKDDKWDMWRAALLGIRAELDDRMDNSQVVKCQEFEGAINGIFSRLMKSRILYRITNSDFQKFFDYELYLGRLEHSFGLSMPDKKQTNPEMG